MYICCRGSARVQMEGLKWWCRSIAARLHMLKILTSDTTPATRAFSITIANIDPTSCNALPMAIKHLLSRKAIVQLHVVNELNLGGSGAGATLQVKKMPRYITRSPCNPPECIAPTAHRKTIVSPVLLKAIV